MNKFVTSSAKETQQLGEILSQELLINQKKAKKGQVLCLFGDLGSGKTTFTQGLLKGLKIKGPYTSPTFVIMKHYKKQGARKREQEKNNKSWSLNVYHIDAYRVWALDILNLGWKEITADKNNIIVVEWAEKIKKIIPKNSIFIKFKWLDENRREISFKS